MISEKSICSASLLLYKAYTCCRFNRAMGGQPQNLPDSLSPISSKHLAGAPLPP